MTKGRPLAIGIWSLIGHWGLVIGIYAADPHWTCESKARYYPPVKVLLANPRGFCAGVNMAVDVVDQVLQLKGAPVYVFHEIVHNKTVVEDFKSRGVTFVDSIEEVPAGGGVVFSGHGIPPGGRGAAKGAQL